MSLRAAPAGVLAVATEIRACRSCGGRSLTSILDLGSVVLSDYLPPDAPDPPYVPIDLIVCEDCSLVQLRHTTNPERMFREQYWYESGINETMVDELRDVVRGAREIVGGVDHRDLVIDIGANDGTLLRQYPDKHLTKVAFEPALRFYDVLRPHAAQVIPDFFPQGLSQVGLPRRSAKIITAIACFYDVDAPLFFIEAIDYLLHDAGVFVVQFQDLAGMVAATGFDNCCPEHLCYYSTATLEALLDPFNLQIVQVERRAINGGSVRAYIRRRHIQSAPDAQSLAAIAWEAPWVQRSALDRFAWRAAEIREQTRGLVDQILRQQGTVDLYAASTKSSILLQACGLTHHEIRTAVERAPEKYGRVTSGTRIPIIPEGEWRADPAPYTLLGAWGFKGAFVEREREYLARGGRFIAAMPYLDVIGRG